MTSALELVKKRVDTMSTPALLRLLDVRLVSTLSLLHSHPARRHSLCTLTLAWKSCDIYPWQCSAG